MVTQVDARAERSKNNGDLDPSEQRHEILAQDDKRCAIGHRVSSSHEVDQKRADALARDDE